MLLCVPNFSEGRSERIVDVLGITLGSHARLLNTHFDGAHNRSVFTLSGEAPDLIAAALAGAKHAMELIDLRGYSGLHPHIGVLDVCPMVWIGEEAREAADAAALQVADGDRRARHPCLPLRRAGEHRRAPRALVVSPRRSGGAGAAGWPAASWFRTAAPRSRTRAPAPHWSDRGARSSPSTSSSTPRTPKSRAPSPRACASPAAGRRGCGRSGCPGTRAARRSRSTSTTRSQCRWPRSSSAPPASPPSTGRDRVEAELVGLAPEAALDGYPDDPPIRDFDPAQHVIERITGSSGR